MVKSIYVGLFQDLKWQGPYLRKFLKKLIDEIESSGGIVLDELYEQYASLISLQVCIGHSTFKRLSCMICELKSFFFFYWWIRMITIIMET